MKTAKAVETHNAIVNAAQTLFMKKSVNRVTVSEITKLAGIAKGTFYVYFESKDDLVWHFMEHNLGALSDKDIFLKFGYEEKDIDNMMDFITDYIDRHKVVLKLMHNVRFYNFLGKENVESKYINEMTKSLYLWLEKGRQLGKLNIRDARFMSDYLVVSLHGMLDRIICEEISYSTKEFGENMKPLLIRLLKGG